MRIVVNDIAASSGGALTVLRSFQQYIVENDKENEWIFLLNDKYIDETENVRINILGKVKSNWLNRIKFDLHSGKKYISSLNPDVVFSLQNTITFGLSYPQVVYMHQSIPFQKIKKFSFFRSEERKLAIYQYIIGEIIKKSIKKADKVIVQTKWIKDSVIEFTNIASHNVIDVFPNFENCSEYKKDNLFEKQNFFYPAAKLIYKNHQCIYDACEILEKKGVSDYKISLTIEEENTVENINYLGELSFESVLENYNTSTLIFPSFIETVGLPMLEARQMGTIILASDCPFSREVLDGYANAYYFNPFKPNELADLIVRVLNGEIVRETIDELDNKNTDCWQTIIDIIIKAGKNNN